MAGGFYKVPHELHRALIRDANTFRVCLELRSRARWTSGPYLGSHGVVELAAGQCVIGRGELAAATGLTEANIRTCLKRLARIGAIAIESTNLGSIVTVLDGEVSGEAQPSNQPSTVGAINQAPGGESTSGSTTSEDLRRKNEEGSDRAGRRKPEVPIRDFKPDNMTPEQAHEFERFRNHAIQHDRRCRDWPAAWRNWLSSPYRQPARSTPGSARPRADHGVGIVSGKGMFDA